MRAIRVKFTNCRYIIELYNKGCIKGFFFCQNKKIIDCNNWTSANRLLGTDNSIRISDALKSILDSTMPRERERERPF